MLKRFGFGKKKGDTANAKSGASTDGKDVTTDPSASSASVVSDADGGANSALRENNESENEGKIKSQKEKKKGESTQEVAATPPQSETKATKPEKGEKKSRMFGNIFGKSTKKENISSASKEEGLTDDKSGGTPSKDGAATPSSNEKESNLSIPNDDKGDIQKVLTAEVHKSGDQTPEVMETESQSQVQKHEGVQKESISEAQIGEDTGNEEQPISIDQMDKKESAVSRTEKKVKLR